MTPMEDQAGVLMGVRVMIMSEDTEISFNLGSCSGDATSSRKTVVMRQVEDQARETCQWVIFRLRIREAGSEMLMHAV